MKRPQWKSEIKVKPHRDDSCNHSNQRSIHIQIQKELCFNKNAANPFEKWATVIGQVLHKIGYPTGNKINMYLKSLVIKEMQDKITQCDISKHPPTLPKLKKEKMIVLEECTSKGMLCVCVCVWYKLGHHNWEWLSSIN